MVQQDENVVELIDNKPIDYSLVPLGLTLRNRIWNLVRNSINQLMPCQ